MPQNALRPPIAGAYSTLRGEIWEFISHPERKEAAARFAVALGTFEKLVPVKKRGQIVFEKRPCTTNDILESAMMELVGIALQPDVLMAIATGAPFGKGVMTPNMFARLYATDPDFVLSVLSFVRQRWKPSRASKAARLFHFMTKSYYIKPLPHQKPRHIWSCTDGEIATAFGYSPGGEPVEIDDVVQARRKVARAVNRSLSVAHRFKLLRQPVNYLHGPVVESIPLKPGVLSGKVSSNRHRVR